MEEASANKVDEFPESVAVVFGKLPSRVGLLELVVHEGEISHCDLLEGVEEHVLLCRGEGHEDLLHRRLAEFTRGWHPTQLEVLVQVAQSDRQESLVHVLVEEEEVLLHVFCDYVGDLLDLVLMCFALDGTVLREQLNKQVVVEQGVDLDEDHG